MATYLLSAATCAAKIARIAIAAGNDAVDIAGRDIVRIRHKIDEGLRLR